ncbi:shikimate kinase [Paracoccaceae bacterium]|nr:shikimate kinase [Paracoccaceae bacterium]
MKQILSKSLVLIGMMGSGKSSVGQMLSNKLGVSFSDSDEVIVRRTGMTVYEIFQQYGEGHFRMLEENVILQLIRETPHIISTGGGAILSRKTRSLLKTQSFSIWVHCDEMEIAKRIEHQENRPLLDGKNLSRTLLVKSLERNKFYKQANLKIFNEIPNIEITVNNLIQKLVKMKVIFQS